MMPRFSTCTPALYWLLCTAEFCLGYRVGTLAFKLDEVVLQGFNWECTQRHPNGWYSVLARKAASVQKAGFTSVWMPPASISVSREGYMPRELENLNSAYGSEHDLRGCISAFHDVGVKVLADVVINHRCAGRQNSKGQWNQFDGRYPWGEDCLCSSPKQFGGTGAKKEGDVFGAAPNIDHQNERVRQDIKDYLNWLQNDLKFDGWRFDFAKGFSGRHVGEYIEATQPQLAIGEIWTDCDWNGSKLEVVQDEHRQRTIDWVHETGNKSLAFDFTTKAILQEAVMRKEYNRLRDADGRPPGVLGWEPQMAVTFLDNHDTGSTQNHWPFPAHAVHQGYAYILTHPGTPCVFYDHVWSGGMHDVSKWRRMKKLLIRQKIIEASSSSPLLPLKDTIIELIALRKRMGISATSKVEILEARSDVYAAVIDGKLLLKIGPGKWTPKSSGGNAALANKTWLVTMSGYQYTIWEAHSQ
ncbi:hypothetical protein WJX73_001793 [Symbiochloris irregularis]|uniref:Alpha-amylase n=1 Tax=Symbiochloris irregularis TaxID=706552 RepID=A0AAW1NEG7_9CHLO